MAKKKKVKKRHKITPGEHLQTLIRLSENAISDQNSSVDTFFSQQISKLKKQLKSL